MTRTTQSLFLWLLIGLMAGWVTGKVTSGAGFGILGDLVLGLVGAVIGGWIFGKLGIQAYGFLGSLASATVGAIALVVIARLLR